MSRSLNPTVMAYVPRKVEFATKATRSEMLAYPLPPKPLSAPSPRRIRQPRVREIVNPRVHPQSLGLLENIRVIHLPENLPTASSSKRLRPTLQNRKKQRRGKQPLFDFCSIPQETSPTTQILPDLHSPPVVNGSTTGWKPEASHVQRQLERLQEGAKHVGCHLSPFLPKTAKEFAWYNKQNSSERAVKRWKARKIQLEEKGCPKIENHGENCMRGKNFETNHSAVLAIKTIWCPRAWPDEQGPAHWPHPMEFSTEGWDRQKNGYGRFLPVPRSEDFEWRLATPEWLANPRGTKCPMWDRKGKVPYQEKRFARIRGELDCIVGSGRWVDEEYLFDRADETAWEDGAEIIGKALWEAIEEDERDDIEEVE